MSVSALAKRAKVDRGRLAALEAGESVSDRTVGKVTAELDRLERELGMDVAGDPRQIGDPDDALVEFTIEGTSGVRAVVKGPIANMAALQAAAAKLVRDMQADVPAADNSGNNARIVGGE